MFMLLRVFLILAAVAVPLHADTVRVSGSSTVAQALQAAAPVIKERLGAEMQFETQAGSSGALQAIGQGTADVAMVSREVKPEDRAEFPSRRLFDLEIGLQVLVPIVSRETWNAGVKSIRKEDFLAIYEGDLKNWKQLGAEDRAVKFYNPEPGRGVWELFVGWLYGDVRKAPLGVKWEQVPNHQSARDAVEFTQGSISVASPQWADGKRVIALPVREGDGADVAPTLENFQSQKWPLARPLFLVTADRPTGTVRKIMEIMVQKAGQDALTKVGFIPVRDGEGKLNEVLRK
jgi:phosphate transport system substrate-binding protein